MVQLQAAVSASSNIAEYTSQTFSTSSRFIMENSAQHPTVCKLAVLRKVKTNKHKFFVLHKDSAIAPARLEYYESESQWIKKKKARRTIYLHTCLSITSYKSEKDDVDFGIVLYRKEDHLKIAFSSEQTRDMWLADMLHIISHSSLEPSYSAVQNSWSVRPHTRGLKLQFEGNFKLCLNESQASLFSTETPQQVLTLPLSSITECHHTNNMFGLEVNHNSETGAGEIWFELEDSLIAQHAHRAFTQNLSIVSARDCSFRPVSKSLSYKDKKSACSTRLRSGSDARQRDRIGLLKRSQITLSCNSFSGSKQRNRSDSIGSHSTNASLSTDESDYCRRSVTPDPRTENKSPYMPLNIRNPGDSCKCLSSPSSSLSMSSDMTNSDSYADMTHGSSRKPQDRNSNFVYMDMTGCHNHPCLDTEQSKPDDYIDMTAGQCSPNTKGCRLRPEPVKCYLVDNKSCSAYRGTESSNSQRPAGSPLPQTDEYVEMCRRKMLTDKSSSAPHLLPIPPYQQHQADADLFMHIDFDNRDRTASLSCAHRPRGSSLSQMRSQMRPRSSTTDQKSRMQRAHNNNLSVDYIDMTRGSIGVDDSYVEMSLDRRSRERLASIKYGSTEKEDKENRLPPPSTRTTRVPSVTHPFPELLSASSEDDVSVHSMEESVSLHSLTNSADSMSTSSHSSHHSSAFIPLDMEPYIAMQPAPTSSYVKSSVYRGLVKPVRVASYILDDSDKKSAESTTNNHAADYMEMSPAANKHANR